MATYDFTGANGDALPSGLSPVDDSVWSIQDNALQKTGNGTSGLNIVAETVQGDNFDISVDVRLGGGSPVKSGVAYNIVDSSNFSAVSLSNSGVLTFERYANGSRVTDDDIDILTISDFSTSSYYNISIRSLDGFMTVKLDGQEVFAGDRVKKGSGSLTGLWTLTGNGVLFDNLNISYPPGNELSPSETQSGNSRKVTKLNQLFDIHSQIPSGSSEYWTTVYHTTNFNQWPVSQYPLVMYSSTDHDDGSGGIYLRVYESSLGDVSNPAAWHEWQDISSRAEFSHITEKGSPIFVTTGSAQVETPTLLDINGNLRLFFHQSGGPYNQSTYSITGTNGVDFSNAAISFPYDNEKYEGNGHNGYFQCGPNPFTEIPYNYIGTALHGGGSPKFGYQTQILVSNDGENWEFYKMAGKPTGFNYLLFEKDGMQLILSNLDRAIPEGDYYRVIARNKVASAAGNVSYDEYGEVLVDSELRVVSEYKSLSKPDPDSWDDTSLRDPFEFDYDGSTYIVNINKKSTTNSKIGISLVATETHDWEVRRLFNNKSEAAYQSTSSQVASGLTYNGSASATTLDSYNMTTLTVPLSGSEVSAESNDLVTPSEYDYVDLFFELVGKDSDIPIEVEMGLADSVSASTVKAAIYWGTDAADESIPMVVSAESPTGDDSYQTGNYIVVNREDVQDYYPTGKHRIGLRLIPSEKRITHLEGIAETDSFVFENYDFDTPVKPFIKANFSEPQAQDSSVSFSSISVSTYIDEIASVAPTANAGTDQSVSAGATVTLDGTGSTIGSSYEWVQVSGPSISIINPSSAKPVFIAPRSEQESEIEVGLTVSLNGLSSNQSTVTITVAAWKGGFVSGSAIVARG